MPHFQEHTPPDDHPWKRQRTIPPTDGDAIARDGESIRAPLMFMDSAQRAVHDASDDASDNGQDEYEARLSDAWRHCDSDTKPTHARAAGGAPGPAGSIRQPVAGLDATDNGQDAYESRLADAWRHPA